MTQEQIQQDALDQALVSLDDQFHLDGKKFEIGIELFREILHICSRVPNKEFAAPPPNDSLVTFLKSLGYKGSLELLSDLYVDHKYQPWRTFATIINKYIEYQIDNRKTSAKRREMMPYPRFTKVIIYYFLSKHSSIPKKHSSCIKCTKDDRVLGKLKFVSKGEPTQVYGMTIPDVMVNDDIKKSKANQTYLAIASSIVVLKKARTGMKATANPTKKGSITAEEKYFSLDLDDVFKVPGEPKGNSAAQANDDDWRSEDEVKIFTSDDERTESLDDKTVSEKADDEEMKDDKEMHDEEDEHDDDGKVHSDEVHDEEKHDDDDEIADKEETDDERTESNEDGMAKNDQAKDAQAEDDQTGTLISMTHKKKPEFPPSSYSISLLSDYGNQFLNVSSDVSLVGIIKETAVVLTMTTPTPSTTPPTTKIQTTTVTATDPSPTVLLRLSELERKVEALSKVDHFEVIKETIQANVYNEVKNQLPKAVLDFVELRMESMVRDVLQKDPINLKQHDLQKDVSEIRKIKFEHANKQKLPKYSATPFDLLSMDEYN
ncbi:hypothetical protein Tco_0344940 [Tanacetum coccineum]